MRAPAPAVECAGLTKSFRGTPVLRRVSLRARGGSILALVGPNGAGKTTLLKILACLVRLDGGRALICGHDVGGFPAHVRARVGLVPAEERSFYWRLSGKENLRFFAALHRIHGAERERRIDGLLEELGLGPHAGKRFREYSSGMKQALGLARALLHDPPVLLLDEPTRSLSPDAARRVRSLLRNRVREGGKAVVIASHNLREVEQLADRIAILHAGSVRAQGTLDELRRLAGPAAPVDLDALFDHFLHAEGAP